MADFNRVLMLGRLTRDPELQHLPNGTAKCSLRLATGRKWKDRSGETNEETCYVDVATWARQAENCKQYLRKGSQVFLEGRLSYQEWEGKDGSRRSKHEVVADRVQFLDKPDGGGGSQQASYGGTKAPAEDLPF